MTIRELHEHAPNTQEFYIVQYGAITPLNRNNQLDMAAYGDFMIDFIEAGNQNKIEITILVKPIKKG